MFLIVMVQFSKLNLGTYHLSIFFCTVLSRCFHVNLCLPSHIS